MTSHCKLYLGFFLMLTLTASFLVSAQEQRFATFEFCSLASGERVENCVIGYRTFGTLNKDKSNAVLVPTWYGGNSENHAYLADTRFIDPEKFFVIIVDAIGNGVSVSPSNSKVQTEEKFPRFQIADIVASQHRLVTEVLGLSELYAVAGLSMGGMQTLQWAVQYPNMTSRYAAIIGTPRLASFDIALWSTRNTLLRWYLECQCEEPKKALAGIGMLGSVPEKLSQDVSRLEVHSAIEKEASEMQLSAGKAWDQIRQAQAMMTHNIARNLNDDMAVAAQQIRGKLLIVVGADDRVVTPEPVIALATLTDATLVTLDKDCGHGDPWCDESGFSKALTDFLSK